MATLSAKTSASYKLWVVKIIVLFSLFRVYNISHTYLLELGSIPVVGSSSNINFDPSAIDIASYNFLLTPKDKYLAKLFYTSYK